MADDSHHNTRLATSYALASATLMIAHQVAGKATRDAVFLSHFDVTELPKIVMAAAILSMLAVLVVTRLLTRFGPRRVVSAAFGLSASFFVVIWSVYDTAPRTVAIWLYLQMAIFGAVLISGFWSVVSERFDPHTAKQTIARVAAAATLGGVIGGLLAGEVARASDVRSMLLVLAFFHIACGFSVRGIGEVGKHAIPIDPQAGIASGLQLLSKNHYLLMMGLLMVMVAVLAALVDYAFKSQASANFTSGEELVSFFGRFYAVVGVVTFLVQSVLGPRVLKRWGIGFTIAVLPMVVFAFGFVAVFVMRFWSLVLLRGTQMVFANSFHRSAFELLYTPLPPATKRPTKAIIDVASDRLGDVIGSGLILLLLALVPVMETPVVVSTAIVVALLALFVVSRLYAGYVAQLASSLRDGAITLSDDDVVDSTTKHALAEASVQSERALLAAKIKQKKYERAGAAPPREFDIEGMQAALADNLGPGNEHARNLGNAIHALLSGDKRRIERFINGDFMDPALIPHLVPLLAVDGFAEDIRMELRWMMPGAVGALTDALLDPDCDLGARQRIPSVLEISHNPRAVAALLSGLDDDEFNVRYSCARALARMSERDASLAIQDELVFAAVKREVSVDQQTWSSRELMTDVDLPIDLAGTAAAVPHTVDYSMEHVFTLLSLVLETDALRLCMRAVFSNDRNLRGTALEYLENVLPDDIRVGLWPHLGEKAPASTSRRSSRDLVEALRSGASSRTE